MRCKNTMFAILGGANDADPRDANKNFAIVGRQGNAAAEPAEVGDRFDLPQRIDSIELTCFAACPEGAVAIKGAAFRVIKPGGEYFKTISFDLCFHSNVLSVSDYGAQGFSRRDIDLAGVRIDREDTDRAAHIGLTADAVPKFL